MSVLVSVLYEDQRGENRRFGLHELLVKLVADVLGRQSWDVSKEIDCVPKKGDSKLLSAARLDLVDIAADCHPVVAVFDSDRIRGRLGLDAGATEEEVRRKLNEGCVEPEKLSVILVVRNMESILQIIGQVWRGCPKGDLRRATTKKDRSARDILLRKFAWNGTAVEHESLLDEVPALRELRDLAVSILRQSMKQ